MSSLIGNLIPDTCDRPLGGVSQEELERRWPNCAGRAGVHSFPLLFRTGRLVIFTDSAIWATELRHQQRNIVTALEDLGVQVVEIKTTPKTMVPNRDNGRKVTLSPICGRNIAAAAKELSDPGLKEVVNRIATRGKDKISQ